MSRIRYKTGFTLLELTITVAIIAILGSVVMVGGSRLRSQAEEKLAESTIRVFVTAIEQYYEFWSEFPDEDPELLYQQLWELTPNAKKICEQIRSLEIADTADGDGKPELYIYDPWENKLEYKIADNFPLIKSFGPDGDPNTADDITSKGM